jgi:hypothetical protein
MLAISLKRILEALRFYLDFRRSFPPAASNAIKQARGVTWTVRKRMHAMRVSVLLAILLPLSLICAFYGALPLHPNAQEVLFSLTVTAGYWVCLVLNVGLAVTFAAPLIGLALWNFGKGQRIEWGGPDTRIRTLSDGGIYPDVLIFTERWDESRVQTLDRKKAAMETIKPGQYLVCVLFGEDLMVIEQDEHFAFTRDVAAKNLRLPEMPEIPNPVPPGFDFRFETYDEYLAFLEWFKFHYVRYAKLHKVSKIEVGHGFDKVLRAGCV